MLTHSLTENFPSSSAPTPPVRPHVRAGTEASRAALAALPNALSARRGGRSLQTGALVSDCRAGRWRIRSDFCFILGDNPRSRDGFPRGEAECVCLRGSLWWFEGLTLCQLLGPGSPGAGMCCQVRSCSAHCWFTEVRREEEEEGCAFTYDNPGSCKLAVHCETWHFHLSLTAWLSPHIENKAERVSD